MRGGARVRTDPTHSPPTRTARRGRRRLGACQGPSRIAPLKGTFMSTIARRSGSILLVSVLAALFLSLLSGPAEAASYRYWGYYTWTDGAWAFATKGPDQTAPADGAVEGWRFAVTTESGSPRVPRADGDFDAICTSTDPAAGKKRVAVVIDGGLSDDAPE